MDKKYQIYADILKEELIPATGCTEPIALAYAAAKARELLGQEPALVCVRASGSIIKNVKSVIVPNTENMKGIEAAAAAGVVAGDPKLELEVLSRVTPGQIKAIHEFLERVPVKVEPMEDGCVFDIVVTLKNGDSGASIRIANHHTNIVHMEKDGVVLLDKPVLGDNDHQQTDRSTMSMEGIWNFIGGDITDDVKEILQLQIDHNWSIAEEGMRRQYGANVGKVMTDVYGEDVRNLACAMAAAGSDARMNGCEMPVVINSGSGNQGITVSVPVITYAKKLGADSEQLYRALLLSNLIAIHIKSGIGCLSAYCGAVCAGAASGAGISYLHGGGYEETVHTVINALAVVSGIICDGAKSSCAAKIAVSVYAGILGYEMYVRGQQFYSGDGIVIKDAENTIRNIGKLARDGMHETNEEIIRIMTQ